MLRQYLASVFGLAAVAAAATTYDYIVVGSGPGGGPLASNLARAGNSVLLLEAGDDQFSNPNVSILANFNLATNDEKTLWDFWVKHSDDPDREKKFEHYTYRKTDGSFYVGTQPPAGATPLGIWYPRAGTLGGCAMHNGGVTFLPEDADWENIVTLTGDKSWVPDNMRKLFIQIENNTYLPPGTPGHGFKGYLNTFSPSGSWVNDAANKGSDEARISEQLAIAVGGDASDTAALLDNDSNAPDPKRDESVGIFNMVFHANSSGIRSGPNSYIKDTVAKGFPLTVQLHSLVTKVLFAKNTTVPTAIGVELLRGKSQYTGDRRHTTNTTGKVEQVFAKKEVIISGGAFNSPQILKLSGIGPADELKKFNIPVVKDLPGVGERLADNYEGSLLRLANRNLTGNTNGAYTVVLQRTPNAPDQKRNVYAFCNSFSFEGFWPGMPTDYGPSEYECAAVHILPHSQAGTVKLRSADPRDTPDINLNFYLHNGDEDLQALVEAIKVLRKAFDAAGAPITPWNELHPCAGVNKTCSDADQREFLKLQAYSHHASASCGIGADDDPLAVLDSKFRVRGVNNLRVVDASAFPRVPGAFPVLPTLLLSEKASMEILGKAIE